MGPSFHFPPHYDSLVLPFLPPPPPLLPTINWWNSQERITYTICWLTFPMQLSQCRDQAIDCRMWIQFPSRVKLFPFSAVFTSAVMLCWSHIGDKAAGMWNWPLISRDVKLTTHIHLVPRLGMLWTIRIPHVPPCVLTARCLLKYRDPMLMVNFAYNLIC
jgi:hypothetical protein